MPCRYLVNMYKYFPIKGYKDTVKLLRDLQAKKEDYWIERGERMALELFHKMAERVPAYKDFLARAKINHKKIRALADFKNVPPADKDNYLRSYPLEKLCWDGKLDSQRFTYSSTSGTTGEPFYFPRADEQDLQYALTAEMYLRTNFQIHKKSTLYVDGFAMGAWIGGLFTYQAIKYVAENGNYKLSVITPGTNKAEILKAVKKLAPKYDQILIGGYPPFVKDTVDEAKEFGVNWKDYNLGFIFSAEGFTEGFRDYIIKTTGLKNIYTGTLNHYGIVDLGTVAHETPLSILVRRTAVENPALHKRVFPQFHRQPTVAQYFPEMFFFEEVNGSLLCTAQSGLPLARYDVKDMGGILKKGQIYQLIPDLEARVRSAKIGETIWNLPFVYLYERKDMVVSWYGANIYPEHIREAHQHGAVAKSLTGKFTMEIIPDKKHNPVIVIHSEMRKNKKPTAALVEILQKKIMDSLLRKNSEFKNSHNAIPRSRKRFLLNLKPYESAPYFRIGGKQKWVLKAR